MSSPTTSGGSWSPRTPLSVTRLAKIANSFGYNLPSPSTENVRRSPSPNHFAAAAASSYVLEVIPPHDLPHDDNDVLTPPPSSATGYHPRYERGILVSVKPTLQSQLAAIAREYALPSTAGLVLYLVNEGSPGPRLSEDVWKVLWSRIMSSDNSYLPPPTPRTLNLLSPSPYHRGSPYSSSVASSSSGHLLHPSLSIPSPRNGSLDIPPSTPSVVSSVPSRSFTKSAPPPSSTSPTDTASASDLGQEPDTPLTSADPSTRANSLESPGLPTSYELTLPGLSNPHALIPVLAKVEFDIDKSKATWFTPWIRSRHRNHAKRRAASESAREDQSETEQEGDSEKSRRPVIDLTIGTKDPMPFSHINGEYAPLSDSPIEEIDQDLTIRIRDGAKDPLADVFGDDQDQWGVPPLKRHDKNVVPLALTPGDLDALDFEDEMAEEEDQEDIDEVREMINNATQPLRSPERNSTAALRRNVPPPLVLQPHSPSSSTQYSPGGTTVTTRLPYLRRTSEDEGEDSPEIDPSTSGSGSGKSDRRRLGIYDDIEFDFPEGDSKEQAQMKAELDAIERTLYQLSPRNQDEFDKQQLERDELAKSPSSSARTSKVHSPADAPDSGRTLSPPARIDEAPPTPEDDLEHEHSTDDDEPAWPATPFSVLKQKRMSGSSSRSSKSSASKRGSSSTSSGVPQLAVNGVSTGAPMNFRTSVGARRKSKTDDSPGSETTLRRKEAEEEDMAWRQSRASLKQRAPNSPIIPLSPDPFGRFSSATTNSSAGGSRASVYWEDDQPIVSAARKQTNPARPSTDSETSSAGGDSGAKTTREQKEANRTTLMSVKGIRNLWRKSSRASSISLKNSDIPPIPQSPALPSMPASPMTPLTPQFANPNMPKRPARPSEEIMELPTADEVDSSTGPLRVPAMLGGEGRATVIPAPPQPQRMLSTAGLETERMSKPPSPPILPPPQHHSHGPNPPFPGPMPRSNSLLPNGPIPLHPTGPANNRPRMGSVASPIMPAKMMPGGGRSAVTLSFDQETPYPVPMRKTSTKGGSPPVDYEQVSRPKPSTTPPLPVDTGRPRSILKSRSSGSISITGSSPPPSPGPATHRTRRPSLLGRNPSLQAFPPDLPPSPQIPQQFLSQMSHVKNGSRSSTSLKSKPPSVHSQSGSYRSGGSRSSHETATEPEEPIEDFEMVNSKLGDMKQLSYPYSEAS